jgi:hypothetical protein
MTKTYKFHVKEHPEFGTLGLAPSWYPDGDPLGGMGAAHDILEHFTPDAGGAEGEFMALGAAYRIRGETGYMQRNGNVNPPESHIAADFQEIFRAIEEMNGHTRIKPCPKTPKLEEEAEEAFLKILDKAKENLKEMDAEDTLDTRDEANVLAWMAYGYRKAGARFAKYSKRGIGFHELAYCLFSDIEQKADMALKMAEEGMVLNVNVDIPNLEVRVALDYPEDY